MKDNAASLKGHIRNIAKEKNVSAQLVLQNYMMERLLERISVSQYQRNFILKGGLLIASMVGISSRTTMDMDITIKNMPVSEDTIREMIKEVIAIHLDDNIHFEFQEISRIRESDKYKGYRVALIAHYAPMSVSVKLDITTGDKVTPGEINYSYSLMMEDREIEILAYNLSTILAEKLETIISRGTQNTRLRDYYDVYILTQLQPKNIDWKQLELALLATAERRHTKGILKNYSDVMNAVCQGKGMNRRWEDFQRSAPYAINMSFKDVCDEISNILDVVLN